MRKKSPPPPQKPKSTKARKPRPATPSVRATAEPPEPAPHVPAPDVPFPLVGVGASAGGLQALQDLFSAAPPHTGMAFLVSTHLTPGRHSLMPELLAPRTKLTVVEAQHGVRVEVDHVYLCPPGASLTVREGTLVVTPAGDTAPRMPIDQLFRSLAHDQKERAIGIVLSGTGTDGTLGLREIKAALGLAMVQDERTALYPSMPHSALATSLVDYVLPPDRMIAQLMAFARRPRSARLADGEHEGELPEACHQVFALLRNRTGHDFSSYKRSTIRRRIERRMHVHQVESVANYARLLQAQPSELDALFKELLIGVTSFFRDPEAFESLGVALAELFRGRRDDHVVRVWVPGCSTGEEAYSLAILMRELMDREKRHLSLQIFATDLDADAVNYARAGLYPESLAADVSPERLERWFTREDDGYRIKKDIREHLIFAPQNMIADPPFTKLDLLSCRNLLIYLDSRLQQRLLPVFHYALRNQGLLFLGSSESVGSFQHLFRTVDKKHKIFQRREVAAGSYVAEFPASVSVELPAMEQTPPPSVGRKRSEANLVQLADKVLLGHLVAPSVLVHERGDIVHIHGRTGAFLEPAPGPQGAANIFNMAREGLQLELASAIRQAAGREGEVLRRAVRVKANGGTVTLDLRVQRLVDPEPFRGLFLVTFDRPQHGGADADGPHAGHPTLPGKHYDRISELERELQYTKESHQSTVEELETANEELKSTNEELQSLNEELATVNTELQGKVEELSRANDDMKNLLNGTDIATIFLDNDLNIKRFTDRARKVIKVIPSDVGRPIADLVSKLRYGDLVADATEVLSTLVFKEIEVEAQDGCWYLIRMVPYRTMENVIDGLVLTFVDVTKIRSLQETERRLRLALQASKTAVTGQDLELRYQWSYSQAFGLETSRVVGKTDEQLLGAEAAAPLTALKRRALDSGAPARARIVLELSGRPTSFDVQAAPMRDDNGVVVGVACVVTDAGPA